MKPPDLRQSILLPVFFILPLWLLQACAEVAPPPGGPVDRTAPQLLATTPINGSVDVAADNTIEFVFSERIVPPVSGRTVFIAPRPETEPDIDWKADRIQITLEEGFAPNQTYLISVAASVADLRGNKLDSSITLAFSTGSSLDSGRVAGQVVQSNGRGARNTYVALFDSTALADSVAYDSLFPTYLTLTNEEGEFSFNYLPPQAYRLVAYQDRNRDELLNPRREQFAVPDRPVDLTRELPLEDLALPLTQTDTAVPGILSVTVTDNNLIRLRLGKAVPLALLSAQPGNARLISVDDTTRFYPAVGVVEAHLETSDVIQLAFEGLIAGSYNAEVTYDAALPALTQDSITFVRREDETPPEITDFRPSAQPQFLRDIRITLAFSEPLMQTAVNEETFLLLEDGETAVSVTPVWSDPMHLALDAELRAGARYRLEIAEFDLQDRAGNAVGDSVGDYSFAVLNTDSLGSISGTIEFQMPDLDDGEILLTFEKVGSPQSFDLPLTGRSFTIELPAGKYLISGFIDRNLNGRKDDGSLVPFEYSETRAALADTIAVRARFETAGIEFLFR